MKILPHIAMLAATSLVAITAPATAATTADLSVTGTLVPASCNLTLSGNTVALGIIPAATLNPTTETALPPDTSTTFTVDCDAPLRFVLATLDQRAGSASNTASTRFGLGMSPAAEKIGSFTIAVRNATDTAAGSLSSVVSDNNGTSWSSAINPGPQRIMGFIRGGDPVAGGPSALGHVTGTMEIGAWIARADSLTLTNDVPIDGLITVELKYL